MENGFSVFDGYDNSLFEKIIPHLEKYQSAVLKIHQQLGNGNPKRMAELKEQMIDAELEILRIFEPDLLKELNLKP